MADESPDREVWINGVQREDGSILFGFDTDNPEFARGFEMGSVYFQMAVRPTPFEIEVHASNVIMAKRAATALNRDHVVEEVPEGLGQVMRVKLGPLPERPANRMPTPMPEPGGPFGEDGP